MEIYRISNKMGAIPFLYYQLTENDEAQYALTELNNPKGTITQLEAINNWRKFIKRNMSGEFRDSDIPCWDGHYDQFGIVMLYLMEKATEYKNNTLNDDRFRDVEYHLATLFDPSPPGDSADRIYYRAWLSFIGHPHFAHLHLMNDRIVSPNICNLHWLMGAAIMQISERNLS